ncbi:MAG: hypothetical protein M1827_007717 [Pycnora praestabilis]|nr:MAG: hypothetical protein M1827_007717 [Pycnora praestabilis]
MATPEPADMIPPQPVSSTISITPVVPIIETAPELELCTIDDNGDLILVVGNNNCNEGILEIRVSSKVLTLASSVFKVMLGPSFAEGNGLHSGELCRLNLPEDNAAAMAVLCQVLHFHRNVPVEIHLKRLYGIAVLCDKYNCVSAVSFASTVWISRWMEEAGTPGRDSLLTITYLLNKPVEFTKVTKELIMKSTSSFSTFETDDGFDFLPTLVLLLLEEERNAIRISMHHLIGRVINTTVPGTEDSSPRYRSCTAGVLRVPMFYQDMYKLNVMPISSCRSIVQELDALRTFSEPAAIPPGVQKPSCHVCHLCTLNYKDMVKKAILKTEIINERLYP